jgi:hypothetical protein
MGDDNHPANRRRAAYKLMFWASVAPSAFTPERTDALCDCLFDCDAYADIDIMRTWLQKARWYRGFPPHMSA